MNFLGIFSVILLVFVDVLNGSDDESRLLQQLVDKYPKMGRYSRPVKYGNRPVNVTFGLPGMEIVAFDQGQQILTINAYWKQTWKDDYLKWDEKQFGHLNLVRIPASYIWTPDITLNNTADVASIKAVSDGMTVVQSDGTVLQETLVTGIKSRCKVHDMQKFPFDEHTCQLIFLSLFYNGDELNITFSSEMEGNHYASSLLKEWAVIHQTSKRIVRRNLCCMESYIELTLEFKFRRNVAIYVYTLFLPYVLLTILMVLIFLLPPEYPSKIWLGVAITGAFFLLILLLKATAPSSIFSEMPIIGRFYVAHLIISTIATLVCALVVNLHFGADKRTPAPRCVKKLFVNVLAQKLCIALKKQQSLTRRHRTRDHLRRVENELQTAEDVNLRSCGSGEISPRSPVASDIGAIRMLIEQYIETACLSAKEQLDYQANIKYEWRIISRVLDRAFFLLYVFCMIVSFVTFGACIFKLKM